MLTAFLLISPEWTTSVVTAGSGLGRIAVGGSVVIAASYLLGIIADRVIDTLLQELERWNRLRYALRPGRERHAPRDPFPEGMLRTSVMVHEGLARYADYLRSRIRLTRALAVLAPVLSTAAVLGAIEPIAQRRYWAAGFTVTCLVVFLFRARTPSREAVKRQRSTGKAVRFIGAIGVPRTDEGSNALAPYRGEDAWCLDKVLLSGLAALVLMRLSAIRWASPGLCLLAVTAAGGGLSLLSLWSWSRISGTFYAHIDDAYWHVVRLSGKSGA